MTLKYAAITANCGNETLGDVATQAIKNNLVNDKLDFCVINCQEVDFKKTTDALKKALGKDFQVTCAGSMVTKTKLDDVNVMAGNTGMASFIICRPGLSVFLEPAIEARRDPTKYYGTALNKGAIITKCTIQGGDEKVSLQLVSGHLDSNKTMERTKDWSVIQNNLATPVKDITDFASLVASIPDIRLSGYDANTRNKVVDNKPVNMWNDSNVYELDGLKQAPLGGGRFSGDSTYKTQEQTIATDFAKGKRQGYTKGGMLDFVDVLDGGTSKPINTQVTIIGDGDPTTKRDHAVIISPALESNQYTPFEKVKYQMAAMLEAAAPTLSQELRGLEDTSANQKRLITVYKDFLSKEGLLNQELELFTAKLGVVKTAKKSGVELDSSQETALFANKTWFKDAALENYHIKVSELCKRQDEEFISVAALKKEIKNNSRTRSNSASSVDSDSSLSNSDTESTKSNWSISSAFSSKREALQSSQPQQESSSRKWFSMRSSSPSPTEQVVFTENPLRQGARERDIPIPSSAPSPVVEKPSSFSSLKAFMRALKPAKVEADSSLSERNTPKNAG